MSLESSRPVVGDALQIDVRRGSIDMYSQNRTFFPFHAWEFDNPQTDSTPTLTLVDPWDLKIEGILSVDETLTITGAATLSGGLTVTGASNFSGEGRFLLDIDEGEEFWIKSSTTNERFALIPFYGDYVSARWSDDGLHSIGSITSLGSTHTSLGDPYDFIVEALNASGKLVLDSAGTMELRIDGTAAVTIDGSGNVSLTSTINDAAISETAVTQHEGAIDHGAIDGLDSDDHPQYFLADGSRTLDTELLFTGAGSIDTTGETSLVLQTNNTARVTVKAGGQLVLASVTLLGTPEAGALEFSNDRLYLTNVGTQRSIDRTSAVITSTTTVANTVTETTVWTGTIGANDLKAGNLLKIHADGVISNAAAADDITISVYLGSDLVATFNPDIGNISDEDWGVDCALTVRAVGEAVDVAFYGKILIGTDEQTESSIVSDVDTTAASDITIKVQWDAADADNTISIYQGFLEFKN